MMVMFFLLFMIPLVSKLKWLNFQLCIILIMNIYLTMNSMFFYSNFSYLLGNDFISYGLILMNFLIISLMVLSSNLKTSFMNMFLLFNLLLCWCLYMIFCSMNLLLMYIFFEFSLIPLLILVFGWGYQVERLISGLYLLFYTLFASLPFLLFIINIYFSSGSLFFDFNFLVKDMFVMNLMMMIAFMVKFPMFMFHFWLPKAHVQAPVFGSMILAGLLLKIGGYGMIRVILLNDQINLSYSYIWYSLSLIGCILVSMMCLVQGDVKSMIAYSSIAHMSLCIMGILTFSKLGLFGSFMLMISHGLCSSALFCLLNISYTRYLSRSFYINKGLMNFMPSMSIFWFTFCAFNMSCPPSLNFISEVFIITSMIYYWSYSWLFFILISLFSACFSYYLFSFTQHGCYHYMYSSSMGNVREYLLLLIHLIPLILIVLNLNLLFI